MTGSLGNQLKQIREQQGIKVEDAARALKMKPARLLEIEEDEYGNFPSLAYARGFVMSYGRFLKFDVKPFLKDFESIDPLGKDDFPITPANPAPNYRPFLRPGEKAQRKKPPLFSLLMILIVVVVGVIGFYLYSAAQRIGLFETAPAAPAAVEETMEEAQEAPVAATPVPEGTADEALLSSPAPLPIAESAPENSTAIPPAEIDPAAATLVVAVLRRTWVKVVVDEQMADPIFQDWIGPEDDALQIVGTRFFVDVADTEAVEVFMNGTPVVLSKNQTLVE